MNSYSTPVEKGDQPLVSVVIPTHNRAHCLERSIQSVLNQTYQNVELIVVDDYSSDDTDALVRSIPDSRLKYIKLEKKSGACAARNAGILRSTGGYVAFQDSDDEWFPDKLELQVKLLRSSPALVGLVYGKFDRLVDGRTHCLPDSGHLPEGTVLPYLLKDNFVSTQVMLVRRECFDRVGMFDEMLKRFQDWEFAIRAATCYEMRAINRSLATSHHGSDSITSTEDDFEALNYIYDKHRNLFSSDPVYSRLILRRMAFSLTMQGYPDRGRKLFERSFNYREPFVNGIAKRALGFIPDMALRRSFMIASRIKYFLSKLAFWQK